MPVPLSAQKILCESTKFLCRAYNSITAGHGLKTCNFTEATMVCLIKLIASSWKVLQACMPKELPLFSVKACITMMARDTTSQKGSPDRDGRDRHVAEAPHSDSSRVLHSIMKQRCLGLLQRCVMLSQAVCTANNTSLQSGSP